MEREHIGRLAGVDERLYGVQPGPLAHGHRTRPANPGPLVSAYDSFGGVTPIVFGYQAEASDGACDLIKALAEAWAPDLAERYVIDSAEAAVGVATDLLREEIGAAVFKAQATVLLDRLRYCMPGHEEAEVRRHTQRKQWLSREAHASCRGRAMARFRCSATPAHKAGPGRGRWARAPGFLSRTAWGCGRRAPRPNPACTYELRW